jgi:hypothetical protein
MTTPGVAGRDAADGVAGAMGSSFLGSSGRGVAAVTGLGLSERRFIRGWSATG